MADAYDNGRDLLRDFVAEDFRVLLLQDSTPYSFNAADQFVADLDPASTESAGGNPENVTAMVLYLHVTDDTDSILVGHFDLGSVEVDMTSYAREALSGKSRTVNSGSISYDATNPTFGGALTVVLAPTGIAFVS